MLHKTYKEGEMSDPSLLLKVLQPFDSPAQKALGKLWRGGEIRVFKFRNRKRPLSEAGALQAATSLLGGDVAVATSFRNIRAKHTFIAALVRSSERDFDWRVFLLEQLGSTFQVVWKSEMLASLTKSRMEVHDLDDDGNYEVIYEDQSFGTGGGYRSLHVYFPERKQLHTLRESLNWQDLSGPVSPTVTIEPMGEKYLHSQIEKIASTRGFLQPPMAIDFDKPEFAAQRWHKENGKFPQGKIKFHYYKGAPHTLSTLITTVRASDLVWFRFSRALLSSTIFLTIGTSSYIPRHGFTTG
jgi:hypothetical protein